ncbi:hypothetical protein AAHE18_13G251100 [Arachis hypogaea]
MLLLAFTFFLMLSSSFATSKFSKLIIISFTPTENKMNWQVSQNNAHQGRTS